nr:MAG TPA: hypothetical protein [Caudoviricetes sp.]
MYIETRGNEEASQAVVKASDANTMFTGEQSMVSDKHTCRNIRVCVK